MEMTDQKGAFRFTRLGADRYFVLVRCHRYLPGEQKDTLALLAGKWQRTKYDSVGQREYCRADPDRCGRIAW
jgi:hypothetical protein